MFEVIVKVGGVAVVGAVGVVFGNMELSSNFGVPPPTKGYSGSPATAAVLNTFVTVTVAVSQCR